MTTLISARPPSRLLWSGAAALLLLPALAMLATAEVRWGKEDFATLAALLLAVCVAVEGARRISPVSFRRVTIAMVTGMAVLAWALLATAD